MAVIAAGSLSACSRGPSAVAPTTTSTTGSPPPITQGGTITVAAEGEPGCMDWISTCAGSSWGVWTIETNTMPRAYDYTSNDEYKPSILLTGQASVQTSPFQVVTYRLNPRAVWSDGQPITSADFQYTWDQIAHGQDIQDQAGYDDILSVDDSDPEIAVVTFSQPYADWRELFGGPFGLLPSHILEGQDRDALMKGGYTWSGGPWELAPGGWVQGQSITLVPNPDYWGKRPDLSSVTFQIFSSPAAELQAYSEGQVLAVYPTAETSSAGYRDVPGTLFSLVGGLDYDALWFNTAQQPFTSAAVRQAVAYSLNRAAIVDQVLGPLVPGVTALQSLLTPAVGPFFGDPFTRYRPDATMASQLMRSAGWTKVKGGDWTKGGQTIAIDLKVSTASVRDQQMAQLIQTELDAAGFPVAVQAEAPAALLSQDVPSGAFEAALYPVDMRQQLATGVPVGEGIDDDDPGQCWLFCSFDIPTATNGDTGNNYDRLSDTTLDRYLSDLDTNLDDDDRLTDSEQAETILADRVPALPLVALPDILVVNTDKLAVEGGTFQHNLAYGPYGDLNDWYLK